MADRIAELERQLAEAKRMAALEAESATIKQQQLSPQPQAAQHQQLLSPHCGRVAFVKVSWSSAFSIFHSTRMTAPETFTVQPTHNPSTPRTTQEQAENHKLLHRSQRTAQIADVGEGELKTNP